MLKEITKSLDFYFALALSAIIPNLPLLIPIVIALWVLTLFFRIRSLKLKFSKQVIFLLMFFLVNLLGMTYTSPENISRGWFDIEIKLSFLLFPLLFFFIPKFSAKQLQLIVNSFIVAVLVSVIWHYLRSVFQYYSGENVYTFYGKNFTKPFHIGYYAVYVNVAFLALLTLKKSWFKNNNVIYILAFGVITVGQFFTTSKIGIITFLALTLGYFICQAAREGFKKYHTVLLGLTIIMGVFFANSKTGSRFRLAYDQFFNTELSPTAEGSTQARFFALKTVFTIIEDHWVTGVGTGDIDIETQNRYKTFEYTGALKRNLNAHNQFLQTFAALGLLGFISILGIFISMFYQSLKNRNQLLLGFALICFIFALTESMFETQAGIVFFTFFSLILSQNNSEYDSIFTSSS